ncbi:MAG: tetratricopeptide repeat protein, partial [Pseudomonadota bacterium]
MADAHAALDDAAGWLKPGTGPGYLASEIAETRAALLWLQRNPDAAIEEAERALHLSDHPHATGRALLTLGWACFSAGRFQDARHSVEECLDLVAKKNLKLVEPEVKALAVRFHWYADPSASQMEHATEFVGRAHRIGLRQTRVETRVARLEIAWELENWDVFDEDVQAVQS